MLICSLQPIFRKHKTLPKKHGSLSDVRDHAWYRHLTLSNPSWAALSLSVHCTSYEEWHGTGTAALTPTDWPEHRTQLWFGFIKPDTETLTRILQLVSPRIVSHCVNIYKLFWSSYLWLPYWFIPREVI